MKTPQGGCFHATGFTETPRLGLQFREGSWSAFQPKHSGGQGFLAQNGERVGGVSTCTPSPPSKGGRSLKTPQGGCFLTPAFTETLRLGLHSEANAEFENPRISRFEFLFSEYANPGTMLVDQPLN